MEKNTKNFYLGLDIGTESVGWAVTDENYKVLRHQGKSLWGVRMFTAAETAAARRQYRISRRRYERRSERLSLLQGLFAPIIQPLDPSFFARLEESNLYREDKTCRTRFSLFADNGFTDVEFHRAYPTVYHLRLAMLTAEDPDPRLVYLALHHMIKYRGHFLMEGDSFEVAADIAEPLAVINQWLVDNERPTLCPDSMEELRSVLASAMPLSRRKEELVRVLGATEPKNKALAELIAGAKVDDYKVIGTEGLTKENKTSIDFNADWDTLEAELSEKLGDDFILIENAKLLYDYGRLKQLLGNKTYLSEGMVAKYRKHKSDLASLKAVMRRYYPEDYAAMFGAPADDKVCNYTVYSGKYDFGPRGTPPIEAKNRLHGPEEFGKYVEMVLRRSDEALQDPRVQAILEDIKAGVYMPKQVGKDNAVLPYQCHLMELQAILAHLSQYPRYAFLTQVDEHGISVADKIQSLLRFRMPYYVGPVNNRSGRYWIVRRKDGKIYPWNLEEMVDLGATEQRFTERMTNDCPYIPGAKVLPKNSLLYEEASLLNLINKIRLNGEPISVPVKTELSRYFALPHCGRVTAKMTQAALKKWLVAEGHISRAEAATMEIGGIDEEITANRRTYAQLCKIMGGDDVAEGARSLEAHRDEWETIILWATVAGPEKSNLRQRLTQFNREHGHFLTDEQIKRVVGLTIKGWGRYSAELLCGRYGVDPCTGEVECVSVLDMLRQTNCNLSELLKAPQYGFVDALARLQDAQDGKVNYATVDALYCSPAVKKQIWQAVQVVYEIKKVVGDRPLKVFVEMARGDDAATAKKREGRRNLMRHQELTRALKKLAEERKDLFNPAVNKCLEELTAKDLQQNKLFLYFMQNGLDAYTGEPIDYNNLRAYDRDHIYPQSKIKDDSIHDNMVLTHHRQNLAKGDCYPLSREVQARMQPIWQAWLKCGLITKEKYRRLTRTTPIGEEECADFINRQLVETRQSTKEVCRLLRQIFPDSEIVYSKASLVSEFRHGVEYAKDTYTSFVKVREINDLHHAKDAYLNIVVGNVYNTRFGHDARVYFAHHDVDHVALSRLFMRDTAHAWVAGADGTIGMVRRMMQSNAILFTRESRIQHGGLFNATVYPKGDELVPLKMGADGKRAAMSDSTRYGGYDSETRAYYMLVQHRKKGKPQFTLVGVVARLAADMTDDVRRAEYCRKLGYVDPVILLPCVKIDTLIFLHGALVSLSGMTNKQLSLKPAMQLAYSSATEVYLKRVYNAVRKNAEQKGGYTLDEEDGIDAQANLDVYDFFVATAYAPRYQALQSMRSFAAKLQSLRDRFIALSDMEQCTVLVQIARVFKCDVQCADLSVLGEGKSVGMLKISNTFSSLEGVYLLHRSVTGIFEQKIALADLVQ